MEAINSDIMITFYRTDGKVNFGVPTHSLYENIVESWDQKECPQCIQGVSLTKRVCIENK